VSGGAPLDTYNTNRNVNVHYEPPEDGLVRAETYVGDEE
jgi:hypothetical protein